MEIVLFEKRRNFLDVHKGELWLDECEFGDHDLVFVLIGLAIVRLGHLEADPIFWFFRQAEIKGNLHLTASYYLGIKLTSAALVVGLVT